MPQHSPRGPDLSGYLATDTIAALATPVGGAVAIIRVSGPGTRAALISLCPEHRAEWTPRLLERSLIKDREGRALDDALVAFFPAPRSLTGEDCAEFQIHGGSAVAEQVLSSLERLQIRQALPGEFSFRAVRNGKMTLIEAQAVADLIAAQDAGGARLAIEKVEGSEGRLLRGIADQLRTVITSVEAGIDFSDQDLDDEGFPALQSQLDPVLEELNRLAATYERGRAIQEGVRVALLGIPNAGKSSFFNALVGEERAIVSPEAGTTRDVIRERVRLNGPRGEFTLKLEDTAGIRDQSGAVERIGVERALGAATQAELILLIVDAGSHRQALLELLGHWCALGAPIQKTLGILTKTDLGENPEAPWHEFGVEWVRTSALTGAGIVEASQAIARACDQWVGRAEGEVLLTRADHLTAVRGAFEAAARARKAPGHELLADDLRHALRLLAPLIGETPSEEILGRIFSTFCIGK